MSAATQEPAPRFPELDLKRLDMMLYLVSAIEDGWQVRKLPRRFEGEKPRFEFLRGHLPETDVTTEQQWVGR